MARVADYPLEEETTRKLKLLGAHTSEDCLSFSREELVLQFGQEGHFLWKLCRGLIPQPPPPEPEAERPEVVVDLEESSIEEGISRVIEPGILQLHLIFDPGPTLEINFSRGFSWRVTRERLATLRFKETPLSLRVVVSERAPVDEEQLTLFGKRRWERALDLLNRRRRKGTALMRVVWDRPASRLPERRAHLEGVLAQKVRRPLCVPRPLEGAPDFEVAESWEVEEEWWTERPISRTYVRASLNGACRRLFRNKRTGQWFAQS